MHSEEAWKIYITKNQPFKLFGEVAKVSAFILWTVISEISTFVAVEISVITLFCVEGTIYMSTLF